MAERHKHADLIIAWANGAEIEWFDAAQQAWYPAPGPSWKTSILYRRKPKPDVVFYGRLVAASASACIAGGHMRTAFERDGAMNNIKAAFDGETGELKSVEILK